MVNGRSSFWSKSAINRSNAFSRLVGFDRFHRLGVVVARGQTASQITFINQEFLQPLDVGVVPKTIEKILVESANGWLLKFDQFGQENRDIVLNRGNGRLNLAGSRIGR